MVFMGYEWGQWVVIAVFTVWVFCALLKSDPVWFMGQRDK